MQAPGAPEQIMNSQESGRQLRAGLHSAITKPTDRRPIKTMASSLCTRCEPPSNAIFKTKSGDAPESCACKKCCPAKAHDSLKKYSAMQAIHLPVLPHANGIEYNYLFLLIFFYC